jgi:SNF2 family DNA or RNA helicase
MALSLYPDTLPALIVAPSSTLYTWRRELGVFGIDSVILDGSAVQRRKMVEQFRDDETGPRVMICSYAIVAKHSRVAPYGNIKLSDDHRTPKDLNEIAWATVVADEVHRAKSPKAVQTRALWAVSDHAEYRWGLSGTPIEGSPLDFWALLHFIDPVSWPSSVKYRDRWVEHFINFFGGIEVQGIRADRAEEWRRTTEWQWRRKMLEGLPPRTNEFRFCELKGKALKTYKDMEKQLMAETGDDDVVLFAQNHMVKAGRLLQMANSAIQVETSYDDDGEEVIEVTPIEPSPKLDLMMDTLEDFEGVPLILWFDKVKFMRLAQDRLNAKGIKYVLIDGSMQPKARDASVAAFQNGDVDLILLSVAAAAEGITLTRAPVSINVQRNWSLILNDQKGSRNLRIGSEIHDEILEIDLITQGTIEWDQYMDLEEKRKIRDQVISPLSVS